MTIQGTKISMTRGDSETLTVTLENDSFISGDVVTMTVRPTVEEAIVMQKSVDVFIDGKAVFEIAPSDTANLDFGKYIYDIQLTRAGGIVATIIKPQRNNFVLEEEVTY